MELHFYASSDAINSITDGEESLVRTKAVKRPSDIHVSFSLLKYKVKKTVESENLYTVSLREDL